MIRLKMFAIIHPDTLHKWGYPIVLAIFLTTWATYMTLSRNWVLYQKYWLMPLTMAFGAFVAGSTPQGGAAVAFPVFTKVLHIPPAESRTFGLMIQSVGMVMASWFIIARRIPIMPKVILWSMVGSITGMVLDTHWLVMAGPCLNILQKGLPTTPATAAIAAGLRRRW